MDDARVHAVLDLYEKLLDEKNVSLEQADIAVVGLPRDVMLSHCRWAIPEVRAFLAADRREKAMRWLGFLQGALWALGLYSIQSLMGQNKPPEAAFDPKG
jgi:hypothetical protein